MLILASTSDKINLVTSNAANADVQVSYADFNAGAVTLGRRNTAVASSATTDITGSPAAATQRNVKHISVRNKHASTTQIVTLQHTDGTTTVEIFSCVLFAGQHMVYDGEGGFRVYGTGGALTTNYAVPATRILGRITASTGPVEFLTATQARTVLGLATTDSVTFGKLYVGTSAGAGSLSNTDFNINRSSQASFQFIIGDDVYGTTNSNNGWAIARDSGGSMYQDTKVFTGGLLYYRIGAGTGHGYDTTWMQVATTGAVAFNQWIAAPLTIKDASAFFQIGNSGFGSDWMVLTGDSGLTTAKYALASSPSQGTSINAYGGGSALFDVRFSNGAVNPILRMYPTGGMYFGPVGSLANPGANNIGLGAIPSTALNTSYVGLLMANSNLFAHGSIGTGKAVVLAQNVILDSVSNWKYISSWSASYYQQSGGAHFFFCVAAGTAGNTASLTQVASFGLGVCGFAGPISTNASTVAALPAGGIGYRHFVTDATATIFGNTVIGGGSNKVPVFHDGTSWRIG